MRNIDLVSQSGVNQIVIGRGIFEDGDVVLNIKRIKDMILK